MIQLYACSSFMEHTLSSYVMCCIILHHYGTVAQSQKTEESMRERVGFYFCIFKNKTLRTTILGNIRV